MAVIPNRVDTIMNEVDRMSAHCEPWREFHGELSNAANNNLLQYGYDSVDCDYLVNGVKVLKVSGFIQFQPPEFNPVFGQNYGKAKIIDGKLVDVEPSPHQNYINNLHAAAKHIVEKYGKHMVDLKFGPKSIGSDRFGPVYVMEYTWNYMIP